MRIKELLEGKHFNESEFVDDKSDKGGVNFDLVEDLSFFMHNDDNVYRNYFYPVLAKCLHAIKAKKDISPQVFEEPVKAAYSHYLKEYPIRQLPDQLNKDTIKKICTKIHEEFKQHHQNGHYKD